MVVGGGPGRGEGIEWVATATDTRDDSRQDGLGESREQRAEMRKKRRVEGGERRAGNIM
jgi:hypothetical protein